MTDRSGCGNMRPELPAFGVWQAMRLWWRDLSFAVALFGMLMLYLARTVPQLCVDSQFAGFQQQLLGQGHAGQQGQTQPVMVAWRLVCGPPSNSFADLTDPKLGLRDASCDAVAATAAAAAAADGRTWPLLPAAGANVLQLCTWLGMTSGAVLSGAVMRIFQGIAVLLCVGVLSHDPMHMVMPSLRIGFLLLMLLPPPYPNLAAAWRAMTSAGQRHCRASTSGSTAASALSMTSVGCSSSNMQAAGSSRAGHRGSSSRLVVWYQPNFYWQYPALRQAVVMLQRVVPLLAAASAVGNPHSLYFEYTLGLSLWASLGKYLYQGWMQYMLVLPLSLHIPTSLCEWLLLFATSQRLKGSIYHSHAAVFSPSSSLFTAYHLVMSLLLVVLLPTLAVARLEREQRKEYRQLQLQEAAQAVQKTHKQQPQPQQQQQQRGRPVDRFSIDAPSTPTGNGNTSMFGRPNHPGSNCSSMTSSSNSSKAASPERAGDGTFTSYSGSTTPSLVVRPSGTSSDSSVTNSPSTASLSEEDGTLSDSGTAGHGTAAVERRDVSGASHFSSNSSAPVSGQLLADIEGSLNLAAAAAAPAASPFSATQLPDQAVRTAGNGAVSTSNTVAPGVTSLLGDEALAAIFLAAAGGSDGPAPHQSAMPFYVSKAQMIPASIVVHNSSISTGLLHPTLMASLEAELSALGNLSVMPQMDSVCFDAACSCGQQLPGQEGLPWGVQPSLPYRFRLEL